MYTAIGPNLEGMYLVMDPLGYVVCVVVNKEGADDLLLHLNPCSIIHSKEQNAARLANWRTSCTRPKV